MIDQGNDLKIFTANNEGLLVYNGSDWELYPSPNESIIRSVKVVNEKIYIGCYMEFGYFEKDNKGLLKYKSLSKNFAGQILEDEQFWNILEFNSWILFQSLDQIYLYNTTNEEISLIKTESNITKIFKLNNSIFYSSGKEVFEIINGKPKVFVSDTRLVNSSVIDIFLVENKYLILTTNQGFYWWEDNELKEWEIPANSILKTSTIYCSKRLKNGNFALGTISNGLLIISHDGIVKYNIKQSEGLYNNTILSIFEDNTNNLWLGLDNGISCMNLGSPLKEYKDYGGKLGTVYASITFNNYLYLGTNQGLFYKPLASSGNFQFIQGTSGQVWTLFAYDNTLFCGHNLGTFIVKANQADLISELEGTWYFNKLTNFPDLLIQGNYNGLGILKKTNGNWSFSHKIDSFNYSSKHFEVTKDLKIYVNHEYKGLFELQLDESLEFVKEFKYIKEPRKSRNSSLAKFDDQILYASKEGIYKLKNDSGKFIKDSVLSRLFNNDVYRTGKMVVDTSNKLWVLNNNYIYYITKQSFDNDYKIDSISVEYDLVKPMGGFENISYLGNDLYLMGTGGGYLTIDMNKLNFKTYNISLGRVEANSVGKTPSYVELNQKAEFDYKKNNVSFNYFIPEYDKFLVSKYQYILEGFHDQWSEWITNTTVSFENLPYGSYTFKVRGKVGDQATDDIAEYSFIINRPWYFSNTAIGIYVLCLVFIALIINNLYRRYYHRQREKIIEDNRKKLDYQKIQSEKEIIRLKNEQLVQDVESKNRELAVSTMSLIKKNEFLIQIRDMLKKENESHTFKVVPIIRAINKDINEEDTWNFFKEAFNNADKDFLKKVKEAHPSLTPNDLKLCAYLRLNLSSKEIAPLLNISVRSVEIKRYRLRKKMGLEHEKSLVEYIIEL